MKRWIVWSFVSVATFLVGTFLVYGYLTLVIPDTLEKRKVNETVFKATSSLSEVDNATGDYEETFTDERRIGRRGKNKVLVRCFISGEKSFAEIKFYSLAKDQIWQQKQSFEFEKDNLAGCDPEIRDFNNDDLNDLTYVSNVAARGANEIRTLFIYDRASDNLRLIRNSADRPNLEYNRKLDCITSWAFHGATTTTFLRLDGDELKDFAHVDTGAELSVRVLGNNGWRDTYRRKMSEDDIYTRYSTYDPPRP